MINLIRGLFGKKRERPATRGMLYRYLDDFDGDVDTPKGRGDALDLYYDVREKHVGADIYLPPVPRLSLTEYESLSKKDREDINSFVVFRYEARLADRSSDYKDLHTYEDRVDDLSQQKLVVPVGEGQMVVQRDLIEQILSTYKGAESSPRVVPMNQDREYSVVERRRVS